MTHTHLVCWKWVANSSYNQEESFPRKNQRLNNISCSLHATFAAKRLQGKAMCMTTKSRGLSTNGKYPNPLTVANKNNCHSTNMYENWGSHTYLYCSHNFQPISFNNILWTKLQHTHKCADIFIHKLKIVYKTLS